MFRILFKFLKEQFYISGILSKYIYVLIKSYITTIKIFFNIHGNYLLKNFNMIFNNESIFSNMYQSGIFAWSLSYR